MALSYDPTRRDAREDPYPIYRQLRDESPLHWAPDMGIWVVSRYADVMHILKTPATYSSRAMFTLLMNGGNETTPPLTLEMLKFIVRLGLKTRMNPLGFATARNLIAEDGDSHSQMRAIVNRGFTPRKIGEWEARAREVVEQCVAPLRGSDRFDVMTDLAIPLPVTIIAELLGVERERHADFKRWSNSIVDVATGPGRDDRFSRKFQDVFIDFTNYLKKIAAERRREPRDDLISAIVASEGEAALQTREIVQFGLLLLVAGNETTTNLIGNGANAVLDHPDQLDLVVKDPSLIPQLIEETLRFDAPVQIVFRTLTEDVELHGQTMKKGQIVGLLVGSANRDERRFENPDSFDITRNTQGHVGFGFGHHFCLGASLARLEAKAAFEGLIPELPRFVKRAAASEMVDSFLVRGRRGIELERAA